ncbi:MAG: NAD-dependent succinate-semialdehyde dehydrogenase [Rhizobiaceae bacterium]|nr:NAD-dependent succinate-semialdehyde dehydrogenase [Rhizobiaceae bacterium]
MDSVNLYIDGQWRRGRGSEIAVVNPATGERIDGVFAATAEDVDDALASVGRGFESWRALGPLERSNMLRAAAAILRAEADDIAAVLTAEEGKPLREARGEVMASAEALEWTAEEGRRLYGRTIPARVPETSQTVTYEPIGPALALTPWNFPVFTPARKLAEALAAGCSVLLKAAEETPRSAARVVDALHRAGVPAGAIALVYGDPAEITSRCIDSPVIRKVTFTGSTRVGRLISEACGRQLKKATVELGGHAPVLIFDDVEPEAVAALAVAAKFRNAGQICNSPSRFYVHERIYDRFVDSVAGKVSNLRIGDGVSDSTEMGPLANARRVEAMDQLIADAVSHGARVAAGGRRHENEGFFYQPTVLADVTDDAALMTTEPFGPVLPVSRFGSAEEVIARANRNPYGLAGYAFTSSLATERRVCDALQVGALAINHFGVVSPEAPFGGVKDSGLGSEAGIEGIRGFLVTKYVTSRSRVA